MKRPLHLIVVPALAALFASLVSPVVGTASAADGPVVTVTAPNTKYAAGTNADVTINVSNGGNGDLVVHAQTADGKSYQLPCGAGGVNNATLSCQVFMVLTTRVVATLTGGSGGDASASKKLSVYPNMATFPSAPRGYSGGYALYARGDEPLFTTELYPARTSMCIRHRVQVLRAAGWTTILTGGCKYPGKIANHQGKVAWRWYGSHPAGYRFRVNAVFEGDTLNGPGSGSWTYFKFV